MCIYIYIYTHTPMYVFIWIDIRHHLINLHVFASHATREFYLFTHVYFSKCNFPFFILSSFSIFSSCLILSPSPLLEYPIFFSNSFCIFFPSASPILPLSTSFSLLLPFSLSLSDTLLSISLSTPPCCSFIFILSIYLQRYVLKNTFTKLFPKILD